MLEETPRPVGPSWRRHCPALGGNEQDDEAGHSSSWPFRGARAGVAAGRRRPGRGLFLAGQGGLVAGAAGLTGLILEGGVGLGPGGAGGAGSLYGQPAVVAHAVGHFLAGGQGEQSPVFGYRPAQEGVDLWVDDQGQNVGRGPHPHRLLFFSHTMDSERRVIRLAGYPCGNHGRRRPGKAASGSSVSMVRAGRTGPRSLTLKGPPSSSHSSPVKTVVHDGGDRVGHFRGTPHTAPAIRRYRTPRAANRGGRGPRGSSGDTPERRTPPPRLLPAGPACSSSSHGVPKRWQPARPIGSNRRSQAFPPFLSGTSVFTGHRAARRAFGKTV